MSLHYSHVFEQSQFVQQYLPRNCKAEQIWISIYQRNLPFDSVLSCRLAHEAVQSEDAEARLE